MPCVGSKFTNVPHTLPTPLCVLQLFDMSHVPYDMFLTVSYTPPVNLWIQHNTCSLTCCASAPCRMHPHLSLCASLPFRHMHPHLFVAYIPAFLSHAFTCSCHVHPQFFVMHIHPCLFVMCIHTYF